MDVEMVTAVVSSSYQYRRRQLLFFAIGFLTSAIMGPFAEARCHEEQINSCRNAVNEGRMSSLQSGGVCKAQEYGNQEFSHSCTVTNYLPTVDYCCCVHGGFVMCCRYHQIWDHYRCQDTDIIDTVFDDDVMLFHDFLLDDSRSDVTPPLSVLLPSIIFPFLIVMCCATVAFRAWRRRRKERRRKMDESHMSPRGAGVKPIKSLYGNEQGSSLSTSPTSAHLTTGTLNPYHTDRDNWTLDDLSPGQGRTEPSAPPFSDLHLDHSELLQVYLNSPSASAAPSGDRIQMSQLPSSPHQPQGQTGQQPGTAFPTQHGLCTACRSPQYTMPPPPYVEIAVTLPRYDESERSRTIAGRTQITKR